MQSDGLHPVNGYNETGMEIHPELIRKLADFGILVPCESLARNADDARS